MSIKTSIYINCYLWWNNIKTSSLATFMATHHIWRMVPPLILYYYIHLLKIRELCHKWNTDTQQVTLLSEPPHNYPLSSSNLRKRRIVSAPEDSGRWSAGVHAQLEPRVKSRKKTRRKMGSVVGFLLKIL